ncbi:hypothetical protein MRX96_009971 [Rhipicephalus microplus]
MQSFSCRWWSFAVALVYFLVIVAGIGNLTRGLADIIFHRARTTSGKIVICRAKVASRTPGIKAFPTLYELLRL